MDKEEVGQRGALLCMHDFGTCNIRVGRYHISVKRGAGRKICKHK